MIKVKLDSDILNSILDIEKNKNSLDLVKIPINLSNKFRKNTKKEVHTPLIKLRAILYHMSKPMPLLKLRIGIFLNQSKKLEITI